MKMRIVSRVTTTVLAVTVNLLNGNNIAVEGSSLGVMSFNKDIALDSAFGKKLLKQARRVAESESEIEHGRELEAYGNVDTSWLPEYALKVQGCSHVTTWNDEADDEADGKLKTKRLIKFRLCPADQCNSDNAYGCRGDSYGDYIVDLDIFLINYWEWLQDDLSSKCQEYAWKKCDCYDDDNKDDKFDQNQCEFQCWYKTGKTECYIDYTADDDQDGFQLDNYLECSAWKPPGYNGRKLEEAEAAEEEVEEEVEEEEEEDDDYIEADSSKLYYIGPHCQGSSNIYMGLFTDDTCSTLADKYGGAKTYKALTGNNLPYSGDETLVQKQCLSCASENAYYQNQARMFCKGSYLSAGKCETHLKTDNPNVSGCNFINGISYIEQFAGKTRFNPFSYIFSWVDDYPTVFMYLLGCTFAVSTVYAVMMKNRLKNTIHEREKSKEIAFNAAQVESHYTDVKVKDAFLAM